MSDPFATPTIGSTVAAVIKLETNFANFVRDRERRDAAIDGTLASIDKKIDALTDVYAEVRGGKKMLVALAGAIGGALAATAAWFGIKGQIP